MKSISKLWTHQLLVASLALLLLSGCGGGEPMGTVSGTVTLDGAPVTAGQIGFISASGYSAVADIGSDGSFTLVENLPVDSYTVTVNPPALTEAPGEEGDTATLEKTAVPDGYFDETTSDLKQEITEGPNTVTIELKASGPAVSSGGGPGVAP